MLSQIIRFTLPPTLTISAPEFLQLRQKVAAAGAIAQYFGYTASTKLYSLPKKRHEICWTIQWPDTGVQQKVLTGLSELAPEGEATSLLFKLADNQVPLVEKAFESRVSEFAAIRLSDTAPLTDAALKKSMHKTYLDTYQIQGFTDGHWAYATNANETVGAPIDAPVKLIPEAERRLAIYFLGWESIELHQDGTETPIFAEEINKLAPHFGPGSGAWYATFRKH